MYLMYAHKHESLTREERPKSVWILPWESDQGRRLPTRFPLYSSRQRYNERTDSSSLRETVMLFV